MQQQSGSSYREQQHPYGNNQNTNEPYANTSNVYAKQTDTYRTGNSEQLTTLADRDKDQYVKCMSNDVYPKEKRELTRYVTNTDPIIVYFAKDP